jgi:hypothetical protein
MGKFNAEAKQWYWLSRFLDTMPDPPDKSLKPSNDSKHTNQHTSPEQFGLGNNPFIFT